MRGLSASDRSARPSWRRSTNGVSGCNPTEVRTDVAVDSCCDHPIQQRESDTRWSVGAIGNHVPDTGGIAHHVDGVTGQPTFRRVRTDCSGSISTRRPERLRLDHAIGEQTTRTVQVGEDHLEHLHPSDDACTEHLELRAVKDERNRIETPWTRLKRHRAPVRACRKIVNNVPGTLERQDAIGIELPPRQVGKFGKPADELGGISQGSVGAGGSESDQRDATGSDQNSR